MREPNFPVELLREHSTPFYYYDLKVLDATLEAIVRNCDAPGFAVRYAVKANHNPAILKHIANYGIGAEAVSFGEIEVALGAGIPADRIVFDGVGKTDDEIRGALAAGIECLNVESAAELDVIEEIAAAMGKVAPVALRVNPEIDAHTHHYITTGLAENKFGIALEEIPALVERVRASSQLRFMGFHFHIGSQITDYTPYEILCERINALQERFENVEIPIINVGGGLGVDYENPDGNPIPDFKAYFDIFKRCLKVRPGQKVFFELGRAVVAQCGSLITRVTYVKEGVGKKFVILDGGMTALIRPALYQAHHLIQNLTSESQESEVYDVVGPICESSDTFGTDERLPLTKRGDLIALRSAGAYGEVMASQYNCRQLPHSVLGR